MRKRHYCTIFKLYTNSIPANLYDLIPTHWLSAAAHVRPSQNTQKRCATSTHFVYDRFSATPAGQIPLFSSLLEPVLTLYSSNCIRDSFTFADIINTSNLDSSSIFLCSFDISSLFTNDPLAETIQICADALYSLEHPPTPFSRQIFVELMEMTTSSVEFSCNDIMHRQIDGVAMGSPLGPALANIFVGYYESKHFQTTSKPKLYYRYMDDTFVVFSNEDDLFLDSFS